MTARLHAIRALRADLDGDLETAIAQHRAALAAFETAGDRRGACQTLSNLGFMEAVVGGFVEAETALRQARQVAERMSLHNVVSLANHNLGGVLAVLGRLDEAREVEQRAIDAFQAQGDPRLEGASRVYLARIFLAQGDISRAEIEARRVLENASSPAPLRAGAHAALALALLANGHATQALAEAREAASALETLGAVEDFEGMIGIALAEALAATGDLDAAKAAIAVARRRVLARAARLRDPLRTRFLEAVPDNARCLGLALVWGVEDSNDAQPT